MKRHISLCLAALICVTGCTRQPDAGTAEKVFWRHREEICRAVAENDLEALSHISGAALCPPSESGETRVIEFSCGASGFGPDITHYGFFFSPDNNIFAASAAPDKDSAVYIGTDGDGYAVYKEEGSADEYAVKTLEDNYFAFMITYN